MKKFIIIFFCILFVSMSKAKKQNRNRYFVSASSLILREMPSKKSKKIVSLRKGTPVVIINETKKTEKINGIIDNWVKIKVLDNTVEKVGFVFSGYLSEEPEYWNLKNFEYASYKDEFPIKILEQGGGALNLKTMVYVSHYLVKNTKYHIYTLEKIKKRKFFKDKRIILDVIGFHSDYAYLVEYSKCYQKNKELKVIALFESNQKIKMSQTATPFQLYSISSERLKKISTKNVICKFYDPCIGGCP